MLNVTDYSPCDQITITVSGYNGLNGENETITGEQCVSQCIIVINSSQV